MTALMKILAPMLLILAATAAALAAQTTPEAPKFTLAISTDKTEVTLGSDITITINTSNISDVSIPINFGYHGRMPDGFQFEMRDDQGATVDRFGPRYRKLPNGNMFRLPDRAAGSMRWGGIEPGKSVKVDATISDDYNFAHPGKYTIRVWKPATRGTPQNPELRRIYSNTITITVLPAGSGPSAEDPAATPQ